MQHCSAYFWLSAVFTEGGIFFSLTAAAGKQTQNEVCVSYKDFKTKSLPRTTSGFSGY